MVKSFDNMAESEIKNASHGFVHGHIHRHKTHTHIHGHIHSHAKDNKDHVKSLDIKSGIINDHAKIQEINDTENDASINGTHTSNETPSIKLEEAQEQSNNTIDDCPLNDLPECDEIFCSELDDCFYANCEDTNIDSCCIDNYESICQDLNCNEKNHGPLNDMKPSLNPHEHPFKHENEVICNDPKCLELESSTACCYENHSTKHLNNLCHDSNNDKELFDKIFQELHQDFDLFTNNDNTTTSVSNNSADEKSIKKSKIISGIHYPHEIHPINNIHKAFFHTNILDSNSESQSHQSQFKDFDFHFNFSKLSQDQKPKEDKDTVVCEWDNCFKNINHDEFLNHLYNNHLKYDDNLKDYPCEWQNCNHSDNNLESLLNHLNTHKDYKTEEVLTPVSNFLLPSGPSSSNSITISPKPDNLNEHITTATSTGKGNNIDNSFTISNLSFKPKKRIVDPFFTCHWDIGVDSLGNPIKCNKTHSSAGELQDHLINDHIGSGKSTYECNWVGCDRHNGKIFTQRQKILRHIHIHTNFKPCKCEICGATFAVESMLVQHIRTHSGEKPFKCSICGKKFATSSSLSIHNRVHSGYKPLICKFPGCGKRFSESSNLNKHMKTHIDKHKCDNCPEDCDSNDLTSHNECHYIDDLEFNNLSTPFPSV